MTDGYPKPGIVGELLQFPFPQAVAAAVRAAAISCDQQTMRFGLAAHFAPPSTQRLDCECRCVVVDANAHPSRVIRQDAVRNRFPEILVWKIMNVDSFGLSLALPLPTIIAIFSNKFLLLCPRRSALRAAEKLSPVMYLNCASRSGCRLPSSVFRLACRL